MIRQYKQRFNTLKEQRSVFNEHWDAISKVVRPEAGSFTTLANTKGRKVGARLYDSTGVHANELLAAGFFSNLTNPTTKWFQLEIEDPDINEQREVKLWLEKVSQIMFIEIQRPVTGFITACQECFIDYGAYGNCIMFVTEHKGNLSFSALPLQECYFVENDNGRIITLYRNYLRTVSQLVERYGIEKVHKDIRKAFLEGELDKEVECLHVIEPSGEGDRYLSIYIDLSNDHILSESFFVEMPFMAARFQKTSYEIYGRGPGSTALADLQMLQEISSTVLRGAQKMVDPPLAVPDNAFMDPIKMYPGAVNYMRSVGQNLPLQPININGVPQLGEQIAEGYRNRVREIFYVNQLQLNRGPEMTATEVIRRTEENMQIMGPIMGRALTELLSPCLQRVFGILLRAGKFPVPPEILLETGPNLRIAYSSPMVKVQDQGAAKGLMQAFQLIMPLASIDQSALEVYNVEEIARDLNEMYALSPRYVYSREEVEQIRARKAEQQQQMMQQQNLKDMGIGFNNLASGVNTLSNMQ